MNLMEQLARELAVAGTMTMTELEQALEEENQSACTRTARALARKAAEGGMDAIKLIRELTKTEGPEEEAAVEIRVIGALREDDEGVLGDE